MLAAVVVTGALIFTPMVSCVRKLPESASSKILPPAVSGAATVMLLPKMLIGPGAVIADDTVMAEALPLRPKVKPLSVFARL